MYEGAVTQFQGRGMEEDYQPQLQLLLSLSSASIFKASFESGANDDDDECCMIIGVCEEISWQKGWGHRGQPFNTRPKYVGSVSNKFHTKDLLEEKI